MFFKWPPKEEYATKLQQKKRKKNSMTKAKNATFSVCDNTP